MFNKTRKPNESDELDVLTKQVRAEQSAMEAEHKRQDAKLAEMRARIAALDDDDDDEEENDRVLFEKIDKDNANLARIVGEIAKNREETQQLVKDAYQDILEVDEGLAADADALIRGLNKPDPREAEEARQETELARLDAAARSRRR